MLHIQITSVHVFISEKRLLKSDIRTHVLYIVANTPAYVHVDSTYI